MSIVTCGSAYNFLIFLFMGMHCTKRLGLIWLIQFYVSCMFLFSSSISLGKSFMSEYIHTLGSITIAIELMFPVYLLIALIVPKFI